MNLEILTHQTYIRLSKRLFNLKQSHNSNSISSGAFLYAINSISNDCYAIGDKLSKCKHLDLIVYEDSFRELYRECIKLRSKSNSSSIMNKIL